MLEISQVSKTFFPNTVNERRALQGIDLHLAEGDFVTVIGSNGAGKSTILNTIAGKLLPDTGTVAVGGKDVTRMPDHRRAASIGRVFQDPTAGTAPNLTIEENMAAALVAPEDEAATLYEAITTELVEEAWFAPAVFAPVFYYAADTIAPTSATEARPQVPIAELAPAE